MTHVTISIEELRKRCTDEEIMRVLGLGNGLTVEVRENKPVEPKKSRSRAKTVVPKTAVTEESEPTAEEKEMEQDQTACEKKPVAKAAPVAKVGPTKSQLTEKALQVMKEEGGKSYILEICENFEVKKISLAKESDWPAIIEKLEAFLNV